MPQRKTAFVLPPFATDYPAFPFEQIPGFYEYLNNQINIASKIIDPELSVFSFDSNNFLDHELKSQYMAYIIACSLGDFLKESGRNVNVFAGYSMGLYAALYLSGAVSFQTGLEIIRSAYLGIRNILGDGEYGMGSITGLNREDIVKLCNFNQLSPEIAIQNSVCSFLLSGTIKEINKLIELSREEGALNTRLLNVSIPYHSHYLSVIDRDFCEYVKHLELSSPDHSIISLIDQKLIVTEKEIKQEILRNIYTPLNWYQTQLSLQDSGIELFVECGPGKSLVKNSRFIEGDTIFVNVNSYFAGKL